MGTGLVNMRIDALTHLVRCPILEISRAKALAKFPRSGAAQEAARKKMGLKSRQNRVNSFFLDLCY
jgi:hypothetical protein